MRYLGIDYGESKIGLALSDEDFIISQPLCFIKNKGIRFVLTELIKIIEVQDISKIIIGLPLDINGKHNETSLKIKKWGEKLKKKIGKGGPDFFF